MTINDAKKCLLLLIAIGCGLGTATKPTAVYCQQPASDSVTRLAELDVPLNVQEWAGVDRIDEIVSTGVPMPNGLMNEPDGIAVYSSNGKKIPAQFRVLERWREKGRFTGSVKWLLVTFLTDIRAGEKLTYRLKAGTNPPPDSPVAIAIEDDIVSIGNLTINRESLSPFSIALTTPDGKRINANELPLEWSVWERGPVRSCLMAESPTVAGKFGLMLFVYAYSGQDRYDMTVVLKNTANEPAGPLYFKNFFVAWQPKSLVGATKFTLGGEWGKSIGGVVDEKAILYQDSDGTDSWKTLSKRLQDWRTGEYNASTPWLHRYVLGYAKRATQTNDGKQESLAKLGAPDFRGFKSFNGKQRIAEGNNAQGSVSLSNKRSSGMLLVRNFLAQYPQAVEVTPGRMIAHLWPGHWKGHNGIHWLDDLQRKAHDLSFRLVKGELSASTVEAAGRAFDRPLVIHCGTDWYRQTGVHGYISPRHSETEFELNPRLISNGSNWLTHGGNILDRIRRRYHDTPIGPFIREGQPASAKQIYDAMRHSTGVTPMWPDDYQYPRDEKMLKIGYCQPARKPGDYRNDSEHHGYMPWNNQHWMCDEIPDSWRLFGDPLAYDSLKDMSTYIRFYFDRRNIGKQTIGESRLDAMPMEVIADAYRILGDEALLESLRAFVHNTCWRQVNKQRGYYAPNKKTNPELGGVDKPFMLSTLMDGLREYWKLTEDEVAEDLMLGITDFCIEEGFLNDRLGFRYTIPSTLETSRKTLREDREKAETAPLGEYRAWQMFRPLAWAYLNTGDNDYRETFFKLSKAAKDATAWRHKGSPFPDKPDWGYICDQLRDMKSESEADRRLRPTTVADLRAESLGGGRVRLSWTTPANSARLKIKHAPTSLTNRVKLPEQSETHTNWWAAENIEGEPLPKPGQVQSMIVSGLPAGQRVFALRTFGEPSKSGVSWRSEISNQAVVTIQDE